MGPNRFSVFQRNDTKWDFITTRQVTRFSKMPIAGLDLAIVALWYSKISLDSWTLTWSTPALYSNSIGLTLVPSCNYGKDMRWGNSSEVNVDLRSIILRSNNGLALDDTGSDWLRWLWYAVLLATAVFLRVILMVQCWHCICYSIQVSYWLDM